MYASWTRMSRFTCPELDHSLALVLFPAAMVSEAIRHACPGSGLRPHGKCNASFRPSLFAKSEAAILMIVWWPGFKLKSPVNRWPRMAFWSVYVCCSVSISLGLMVAIPSAYLGAGMAYDCRTIDRSYATWEEMVRGSRSKRFAEWLPHTAADIHYLSHGKFGETTERLTCRCKEADLVRFAHEHAYPLATNAFTMLDYYIPEQGDVSLAYAQMAKDPETQRRLVFGDRPLPERFISLTCSRAFDGGASGGQWRVILVLDRDTDELIGYHWANWL